jgi:Zn-dependent M28 family amino/carboxypeptidase
MVVDDTHNIFYRPSDQLEQNQAYIETTLSNLGYEITQHSFVLNGFTYQNVIATHLGTRYPDQRVLVVAHFDIATYSSGADDNISGVAAMLELAKRLQPYPFEYTIQFIATNQEENSLTGSRALANFAKENGWQIKGVIVLDQVGYAGKTLKQSAPPGLEEMAPQIGDFIAVIGNETSKELAEQFIVGIQQQQIPLPYVSTIVPGNGEQMPLSRHADHAPFWDAGYPAILVTDTGELRNPNTHYSTDKIDTLNLEFLAYVCRAAGEWVNILAISVD